MDWNEPHRAPARPPRMAASVIVLRDTPEGLQVLMQRRAERAGDQNGGACVFPGGVVDDADALQHTQCFGLTDAEASAKLQLPSGGLNFWLAAVRELFEEAGLLYLADAQGQLVDLQSLPAHELAQVREWQHALHENRLTLAELCSRLQARVAAGQLAYYSHWLTPPGLARRFDTRFFIARAPARQTERADDGEAAELLWLTPAQALDKSRGLKLLPVTRRTLMALQAFNTVDQALAEANAPGREVVMTMPRLGQGAKGPRPVLPDEWAYAEISRLDPEGQGHVSAELVPGRPVQLSDRVWRITADNGSVMTGPGTNSYFVADPATAATDGWTLIDPGPDDAGHVQALLAGAPGRITRILVTHTHKDHSPAAQAMHAATGAPLWGRVAAFPEWQDTAFLPQHVPVHGERFTLGPSTTLRVLHTPGHASNHLCYLLEEEHLLFTGDHLMQGSTVVINPPDGDMAVYLQSLELLLGEADLHWLAPGHEFLIDQPHAVVKKTMAHRLQREAKVLQALRDLGGEAGLEALLATVYADVPEKLHAVAARSLRAHLGKLVGEGRVVEQVGAGWRVVA